MFPSGIGRRTSDSCVAERKRGLPFSMISTLLAVSTHIGVTFVYRICNEEKQIWFGCDPETGEYSRRVSLLSLFVPVALKAAVQLASYEIAVAW